MSRDGYQECRLQKTAGRRARWYCRYAVEVLTGPGETRRIERRHYFGPVSEMGKREAERERDAFRDTVNRAHSAGGRESQVPVANWIRTYESTFIPTLKPPTQRAYISYVRMIEQHFGGMRLCDVSTDKIQQWVNAMAATRSHGTLAFAMAVFRSLMEVASDYGYSESRNPCERVRVPAGRMSGVERRALTPEEIRRLLAVADTIRVSGVLLGDIVRMALFVGLRIGEILALQWSDIRGRQVLVTKSRSQSGETLRPKTDAGERAQPLGPIMLAKPDGATLTDRVFPVSYYSLQKPMRRALDKAGIALKGTLFHALRRTYATMRRRVGGGNMREGMGHSTEAMSMLYVRESFADDEAAALRMAEMVMGETGTRQ